MSTFGGFGGFGQNNNNNNAQQNTGFGGGGFGASANNNNTTGGMDQLESFDRNTELHIANISATTTSRTTGPKLIR